MAATVAFYRLLDLSFPEDAEEGGHVEAELPGGTRLMFDTEDVVRSFDPTFEPPSGTARIGLAFLCESPDEVDRVYDTVCEAGYTSERALRRILGSAIRHRPRPGRERRGSLRCDRGRLGRKRLRRAPSPPLPRAPRLVGGRLSDGYEFLG